MPVTRCAASQSLSRTPGLGAMEGTQFLKGSKNCLLIHVLGRKLEKTHDALGSDSSEPIPNHSARALQALGDHEAAQAREQDPQILRRHCRDDLLLTHQQ